MYKYVPISLKLRAMFASLYMKIGLPLLLAAVVLFFVFQLLLDWTSLKFNDPAGIRIAPGWVYNVKPTSTTINKVRVLAYHFRYRIPGEGEDRQAVSYRTGFTSFGTNSVAVEYLAAEPHTARIRGLRTGIMTPLLALVLIPFLLTGGVFFTLGLRQGLRILPLLERGVLTRGQLILEQNTNTTINNRRVVACTFEYEVDGEPYTVTARTHLPEKVTDEPQERIVYHPDRPDSAVLFDLLPRRIQEYLQQDSDFNDTGEQAALTSRDDPRQDREF